mmetsp:Transcript_24557/g.70888  ORF Transcript_24557/g.70888 Transcript_24557/m.70888 type:complete len:121 (+) Transcript_24557:50-412(+)
MVPVALSRLSGDPTRSTMTYGWTTASSVCLSTSPDRPAPSMDRSACLPPIFCRCLTERVAPFLLFGLWVEGWIDALMDVCHCVRCGYTHTHTPPARPPACLRVGLIFVTWRMAGMAYTSG